MLQAPPRRGTHGKLGGSKSYVGRLGELTIGSTGIDAFVNHSPDPTARNEVRYTVRNTPGRARPALLSLHACFVAPRDLEEGEEVTFDYGTYMDARLPDRGEAEEWLVTSASMDTMGCGARPAAGSE